MKLLQEAELGQDATDIVLPWFKNIIKGTLRPFYHNFEVLLSNVKN